MGCVPRLGGMEGSVAMTGCVGDRADNRDNVAATVVGRRRSVEGPGSTKFNRLVRAAASKDRKSVVYGKSVDLGSRPIIKKKSHRTRPGGIEESIALTVYVD